MAFAKKLFQTSLITGGTLGTMALFNQVTESMAGELDTVLIGEERRYPWKYGDMFYEVKGARDAKPLLLIHGFGPGASSYEWRKNIDVLAEQFRVYALDLLGFGLSDRPAIDYTPETFTDLLHDFIKEAIGKPTIVVAHGLTCAYTIACAFRRPQLFERLVLVAPPPTILQETFPSPLGLACKYLLRTPILGQFIYNILTSREAIRGYYDRHGYHNLVSLSDDVVEYVYTSAHQPNSLYPVISLLSNSLTLDVREPLARLKLPIIAIWGREGVFAASEVSAAFQRVNPNIDVRILDKSSFYLQEEQATNFNNLLQALADTPVK